MRVKWKHCCFIEKSHTLTAPFAKSNLTKLSEEALERKKFTIIPIFMFVLKAEICSELIVKAIERVDHARDMASNISNHLKYLQELGTREQQLRTVRLMGAELVRAAIEEEKFKIVEVFLESIEIEGDISDIMVRKRLCFRPPLLSKLFQKGASLETCKQNPLEVVLGVSYHNLSVKLNVIRVLLENGATLPPGAHTRVLHEVVKCTLKCFNSTASALDMVCAQFDFESQSVCDSEGRTPWHLALRCELKQNGIKVCQVLNKYPINPYLKDKNDRMADWGMKINDERLKIFQNRVETLAGRHETKRQDSFKDVGPQAEADNSAAANCSDNGLKQETEVYNERDNDNDAISETEVTTESESPSPRDRSEACATNHSSCESKNQDYILWNIEKSKKVMKVLRNACLKMPFDAKMRMLSQGEFYGNRNHCKSVTPEKGEFYETRLTKKVRLLWQIDYKELPSQSGIYQEIIRLLDIVCDHDNIRHSVDTILRGRPFQSTLVLKDKLKCTTQESRVHKNRRSPHTFVTEDDVENEESDKQSKNLDLQTKK